MRNTVVAAALGLLVLTGCGSAGPASSPGGRDSSATAQGTLVPATSQAAVPDVPALDAEQQRVYLKMLEMVEPGLVADSDRAVSRGQDVCLDIRQGKSDATVVKNVRARFTGGDVEVSVMEAKRIVIAVQAWCQL